MCKFYKIYHNVNVFLSVNNLIKPSYNLKNTNMYLPNCIDIVLVSVLVSSVVDHVFEPQSGQPKDYEIGICCFSAKYAALRSKSSNWLARNQNNVSDMSPLG